MTRAWLLLLCLVSGCRPGAPATSFALLPATHLDVRASAGFPAGLSARASALLPTDSTGWIGRNRTWGGLYSPRFQVGTGAALRTALAAGRAAEARRAFRGVEAGSESVRDDGSVYSALPPNVGGPVSATDMASAAAFYLGDACLGLLVLEASVEPDAVASLARREAVRGRLSAATRWLASQEARLVAADSLAPNRLLFDARAFRACGALGSADGLLPESDTVADRFVRRALALQDRTGAFLEGGGTDTSYQGVAVMVGEDLLLAGDASVRLAAALDRAAAWLAARVGPDGRIDSSDNARTCGGGESVGGVPKRVSVPEVFAGLAYTAARSGDANVQAAASRLESWALENVGADPCFP